jgi:hypothetical protein
MLPELNALRDRHVLRSGIDYPESLQFPTGSQALAFYEFPKAVAT